jgi:hypothetical protein
MEEPPPIWRGDAIYPALRLQMSGTVPLLPLYDFVAWTKALTLLQPNNRERRKYFFAEKAQIHETIIMLA